MTKTDCIAKVQTAPSEVGMSTEKLEKIRSVMKTYVDSNQVPGVLMGIARNGKLVHVDAQGFADEENKKPILHDSIFRIYSMTKPITAVAVMLLYEEGRFFIDDPISEYLPEFSNMKVYTKNGLFDAEGPITIRHLLTHYGGLTYSMIPDLPQVAQMYQLAGINEAIGRLAGWNLEEYVKKLSGFPLISQPGTVWRYSEHGLQGQAFHFASQLRGSGTEMEMFQFQCAERAKSARLKWS